MIFMNELVCINFLIFYRILENNMILYYFSTIINLYEAMSLNIHALHKEQLIR